MPNCLACLEPLRAGESEMHRSCRQALFGNSAVLTSLPYTRSDIIREVKKRALRMSLGGAQPKASLAIKRGKFEVVAQYGSHLLKPSSETHPFISENEHFAMNAARKFGLPIPPLCLIKLQKKEFALLIKRFDRQRKQKIHIEDFASVLNLPCDDKYEGSYQDVCHAVSRYCRDSGLELYRIFQLICLSYVLGNSDLHLKNFSIIDRDTHYELTPIYDVLCSTLYYPNAPDLALELMPKYKGNLNSLGYYNRDDFLNLASAINMDTTQAGLILDQLHKFHSTVIDTLRSSFLPKEEQEQIKAIIDSQYAKLYR